MDENYKQGDNTQLQKNEDSNQDEMSEFIDSIVKENTGLKRQLVLNEIDMVKYQEMLSTACSRYYNLDSGNLNETDRTYYDSIKKINQEHEKKLDEINTKYEKENNKLINDYTDLINKIKKYGSENEEDNQKTSIENLTEKVEFYNKKLKTTEEELFNSEKYAQILQMKYESLLTENEYLKKKIPEEKENLLLLVNELKRTQTQNFEDLHTTFQTNCDLITETYINFSSNEKNKQNLIIDSLLAEKDTYEDKMNSLNDQNNKLKYENERLTNENKKNDDFISAKVFEISTIKGLKENYILELKNYQDEITKLKAENTELNQKYNDSLRQISNLEKKVINVQETVEGEMSKQNEKNQKIIDDLNSQILDLDLQKREMAFNLEQNTKNYAAKLDKAKEISQQNEALKQNISELKFRISELEAQNNSVNNQLEDVQKNYNSLFEKNETFSKMIEECNFQKEKDKVKISNIENEYEKLKNEYNELENERAKSDFF
ncbi:MAG: hypothetical protein MJ252_06935 [archaeon]|nr:hypothetical protein [archaeon]